MQGIYTAKRLRADMPLFNAKLKALGSIERLEVQCRNGYTAVDVYDGGVCDRNLTTGTPRECANECRTFIVATILLPDGWKTWFAEKVSK